MASDLQKKLADRQQSALYRTRHVAQQTPTWRLNFSTNDYLGLSQHPAVKRAFTQAIETWGVGSTGSPLLSGYSSCHQQLEQALCDWLGYPRAVLFNSGFAANHGVLTTVPDPQARIFADRLVHASIIDGLQHNKNRFTRYPHNDWVQVFDKAQPGDWLVSEGVFSMDGDGCDMAQLSELKQSTGLRIMLDDAHGIGAYGQQGRGVSSETNGTVDLLTGTFGKTLGMSGAFVCADETVIESLIQFCREYIYSTAMPPAQAAALIKAIEIVRSTEGDERRARLQERIAYFQRQLQRREIKSIPSQTAIQTWFLASDNDALTLSQQLQANGYLCSAIRPPTVPSGTSRIRFSLTSEMPYDELQRFWQLVDEVRAAL